MLSAHYDSTHVFQEPTGDVRYPTLADRLAFVAAADDAARRLRGETPSADELVDEVRRRWRLDDKGVLKRLRDSDDSALPALVDAVILRAAIDIVLTRKKEFGIAAGSDERRRERARDIGHEVFVKYALTWAADYDPTEGPLGAYLNGRVRRNALRKSEREALGMERPASSGFVRLPPWSGLDDVEDRCLLEAMGAGGVPEEVRRHMAGESYVGIAHEMHLDRRTVRARIRHWIDGCRRDFGIDGGL